MQSIDVIQRARGTCEIIPEETIFTEIDYE